MSDITASESIVSESIVSGRLKNGEKTKLAASYDGAESYNSFIGFTTTKRAGVHSYGLHALSDDDQLGCYDRKGMILAKR
jgi:hypothetical protein